MDRIIQQIPRFFSPGNVSLLLDAVGTTLALTFIGCVSGFLIAFLIVFLRQTPGIWALPLRLIGIAYVEVFRRIPFLVVTYLVLFFIQTFESDASLFTIAVVAICIYATAYTAEIIRGGFAEGLRSVQALRREFPRHPVVADLKTMDGGYLEAEMMAKAGATHVVVMARAHPATIRQVVQAGRDYHVQVMGDDLGCGDKAAAARAMQDLGVDFIVHHVGYDERRDPAVIAANRGRAPSPLDELRAVVQAVTIPVQAVGGLTVEQVLELPRYGVNHLVLGAPLTVDADAFKSPAHDLEGLLKEIIAKLEKRVTNA